ncbi:MAG: SCP2 sterol-binding domain-containing protein [Pseudomonadales bacterium]|nr:SCP2 sterol-binding domain-containing protein [Pseudomonadales bacterium]
MRAFQTSKKAVKLVQRASFLLVETAIEQALKRDPVSQQRLKKLNGKRIAIETRMPDFYLVLAFDEGRIRLLKHCDVIDAQLSCSASNLIQLLTSDNPASLLYSGEIELSGDSHLIDTMQQALAELELDWEALLATLIGDTNAHNVGNLSRTGWRWGKQRNATLVLDIEEYLKEEAQLLPPKPAASRFFSEIDQLRLDADRLQARVQRLSKRIKTTPEAVTANQKDQ